LCKFIIYYFKQFQEFTVSVFVEEDTIAAIATPVGEGGIAVIRISGPDALAFADKGFRGKAALSAVPSHTIHFGEFIGADGGVIDQVVAATFRAPHSYTGEETIELSCHGGLYVSKKILETVLDFGARLAGPGEFTRRAFLNGRIDLAQAEAVSDLIRARSEQSHKASMEQLEGKLSTRINSLREQLLKTSGLLELELDFSEEGLEFIDKTNIIKEIESVSSFVQSLVDSYRFGKVYREGVKVVIAGKPNVGKSSLLNCLLNENRAIVTDIPGTTRDVIEENIVIGGILFRLVDTAGIRESTDIVESEGIRRSAAEMETADVILRLADPTQVFDDADATLKESISLHSDHARVITIQTKSDLVNGVRIPNAVAISSLTGAGLGELRLQLTSAVTGHVGGDGVVLTNVRHRDICLKALRSLATAKESLLHNASNELVSLDLQAALISLGEIVGVVTSEDVLNNIFGSFCIGK